jgi:hypothetical protein
MTKNLVILAAATVLTLGCGAPEDGKDGGSCHVEQRDDGAFLTCDDGTEAQVRNGTDGKDGADGAAGQDGADGKDGADGLAGRVTDSYFCIGLIPDELLIYKYNVVVLATQDVWVTASVSSGYGQRSGSNYYSAAAPGSVSGYVGLFYDIAGSANYASFGFESTRTSDSLAVTITYTDEDLATDKTWTSAADDCHHKAYDAPATLP